MMMQDNFNNASARNADTSQRLADMAKSRQKFTNKQYAQSLRDMRKAEEAAKAERKRSRMGMLGQGIGSVLGGVGGLLVSGGNPMGAMMGASIGGGLGGALSQQTPAAAMLGAAGTAIPLAALAYANQPSQQLLNAQEASHIRANSSMQIPMPGVAPMQSNSSMSPYAQPFDPANTYERVLDTTQPPVGFGQAPADFGAYYPSGNMNWEYLMRRSGY